MDLHRTSFSRHGFYLFVLISSVICSAFKIRSFTRGVTSHIIHPSSTQIYNSQSGAGEASNVVSGMDSVSKFYDSFIIDQWGVLHDGKTPYTGVKECLQKLKDDGKNLILLSNSSKRKANSVKGLDKVGIKSILFDEIVTSGELAWNAIMDRKFDFKISPLSATSVWQQNSDMTATSDDSERTLKVFVIGNNDDDAEYIRSCGCVLSPPESADFILARGTFCIMTGSEASISPSSTKEPSSLSTKEPSSSGPTEPSLDGSVAFSNAEDLIANIDPYLQRCMARGLPMLVSNPDFTRPGSGAPMPGQIGVKYSALGGNVQYIGKPYIAVYNACMSAIDKVNAVKGVSDNSHDRSRVCGVGDSLDHDILGAKTAGINSVWTANGVHSQEMGTKEGSPILAAKNVLSRMYEEYDIIPTHTIPSFKL